MIKSFSISLVISIILIIVVCLTYIDNIKILLIVNSITFISSFTAGLVSEDADEMWWGIFLTTIVNFIILVLIYNAN